MDEVPEDRCGYVSDKDLPPSLGGICCWRSVWENTDSCIWHSESSKKIGVEIQQSHQKIKGRLDSADLSEINVNSSIIFRNCTLFDSDLSGASLKNSVFEDSHIQNTDLSGVEARNITIRDSVIDECDCSEANFRKGEMVETDIINSEFTNSTLNSSDFSEVRVIQNNLQESNLHGTIWEDCFIDDSILSSSKMSCFVMLDGTFADNEVRNCDLTGAIFRDCTIGDNDFSNSELPVIEIEGSNVWRNKFSQATLREASLSESKIGECDITDANLTGADLSQTNARNSDFSNVELVNADFTDSNARSATFDGANLEDATFIRTELRDANLRNARLYQTLFSDTRINSNTDFGDRSAYENPDTELGENYEDTSRWEAAAWVYRRLQDLHEKNAMSERARDYHVAKEEAHRAEYRENGEWFQWGVYTLNRYLTNHGESLKHVVAWSVGIIVACGLLYPFTGGMETANGIERATSASNMSPGLFARSFYYSMVTFTTLGYGNPAGTGAKLLVGLESLAGTLLIALFVFVLGRRVAR